MTWDANPQFNVQLNTNYNYPRIPGFLQSSVIIGVIGPSPKKLRGFDWYGCANYGSNRNAKNIELYGQTPPAPPTGQGIIDRQTLQNAGNTVYTD